MFRIIVVVVLAVLGAASVHAQELAGDFNQLRVLVKAGDTLTVTDSSGETIRGRLIKLAPDSLVLNVSGTHRELPSTHVDIVSRRGPDSLRNGALIGMAIGGGVLALGALAAGVEGEDAGLLLTASVIYAGIGAGIGTGIDAIIEGQRAIYARSPKAGLTVRPAVSGPRKGVLVSFRVAR